MPTKDTKKRNLELQTKLNSIWSEILMNPIETHELFKRLGYDYSLINHRTTIYNFISNLQKTAEEVWDKIIEKDKHEKFRLWMDYCYLHKIPYIILNNGIAQSPKTYDKWQTLLQKICTRQLSGLRTSMIRMTKKNMKINGLPVIDLLPIYKDFTDLIPEKIDKTNS